MNLPIDIKKVFLSFLQSYFTSEIVGFEWDVDPRKTKIFIGDRNIVSPPIIERMPAIIVTRGALAWIQSSIDQRLSTDSIAGAGNKVRTDLAQGNITFQCLSQNGIEAESLASIIFTRVVAFKDQFRSNGIHQILNMTLGEEQVIRGDVVPRLISVPVSVRFTVQASLATTRDMYISKLTLGGNVVPSFVSDTPGQPTVDWFSYVPSGNAIVFTTPPASGLGLSLNYTGAFSLSNYTNVIPNGSVNGVNKIFTLPEAIYSPYAMLQHLEYNVTTV